MKPGSSGSSCRSMTVVADFHRPLPGLAQVESLPKHGAEHPEALADGAR